MANGDMRISEQRWKEMDERERSWILFDSFNCHREGCRKRFRLHEKVIAGIIIFIALLIIEDPGRIFKIIGALK